MPEVRQGETTRTSLLEHSSAHLSVMQAGQRTAETRA